MCIYAVGPKVPVIASDYWMDNKGRFIFMWRHAENDENTVTNYDAWFRISRFISVNILFKNVMKLIRLMKC